jgi:hypothetical protein
MIRSAADGNRRKIGGEGESVGHGAGGKAPALLSGIEVVGAAPRIEVAERECAGASEHHGNRNARCQQTSKARQTGTHRKRRSWGKLIDQQQRGGNCSRPFAPYRSSARRGIRRTT